MNDRYLAHHGILGQKWGIRRYQNKDGSLTYEGKARYYKGKRTANAYADTGHVKKAYKELGVLSDMYGGYDKLLNKFRQDQVSDAKEVAESKRDLKKMLDQGIDVFNEDVYHDLQGSIDYFSHQVEVGEKLCKLLIDKYGDTEYSKQLVEERKAVDSSEDWEGTKKKYHQKLVEKADKDDKYESDFLETTQNMRKADPSSPIYDKKWKLKEYSKYLDDPAAYMKQDRIEEERAQEREEYEHKSTRQPNVSKNVNNSEDKQTRAMRDFERSYGLDKELSKVADALASTSGKRGYSKEEKKLINESYKSYKKAVDAALEKASEGESIDAGTRAALLDDYWNYVYGS